MTEMPDRLTRQEHQRLEAELVRMVQRFEAEKLPAAEHQRDIALRKVERIQQQIAALRLAIEVHREQTGEEEP